MKRLIFLLLLPQSTAVDPTRLAPNQINGHVMTEYWSCTGTTGAGVCDGLGAGKIRFQDGTVTADYVIVVPAPPGFDPSADPRWSRR